MKVRVLILEKLTYINESALLIYTFSFSVGFGPYWNHVLDYWNNRNQPNMLFVKYEDMKKVI